MMNIFTNLMQMWKYENVKNAKSLIDTHAKPQSRQGKFLCVRILFRAELTEKRRKNKNEKGLYQQPFLIFYS